MKILARQGFFPNIPPASFGHRACFPKGRIQIILQPVRKESSVSPFSSLRLSAILLSASLFGLLAQTAGLASTASGRPVELRTLVVETGSPGVRIPIPRTSAFAGSRKMVFRFLGTPKFFVGVIIQSFDARGHLLHHGLFDQGPIDEVLSRALFHRDERIQILGIFQEGHGMVLRIRRFASGQLLDLPLDRALSLLTARIGSQKDLVWAAR